MKPFGGLARILTVNSFEKPMYDDLPRLFGDIERRGLRVNNLFQLRDGDWQCNLRDEGEECADFGFGNTPGEAIKAALAKVPDEVTFSCSLGPVDPNRRMIIELPPATLKDNDDNLDDLLS